MSNGQIDLGPDAPKREQLARKMQCMRMQEVLVSLHTISGDVSRPDDERTAAAQQLAGAMLSHFELIVWALRVAGGARRP